MSAEQSLVSVIIPAYNAQHYIVGAVRSALDQTYANVQVIVIDDGSNDDTESVLRTFQSESRFHYERQNNAGPHRARNRGLELAKGNLIAFLDADDLWYPHKLDKQLALFRDPRPGVVYSARDFIDAGGRKLKRDFADFRRVRGDRPFAALLEANCVPMSTAVARREIFEIIGGFDESLPCASDWDFWLRASVHCWFDYVDERLAAHRKWDQQITANRIRQADTGIEIQRKFLNQHPGLVSRRQAAKAWSNRYARRGRLLCDMGRKVESATDLLKALWFRPTNLQAAKTIINLAVGRF